MKQIRCPNCGSDKFITKDGMYKCSFCDSFYQLEEDERQRKQSEVSLQSDIDTLLQKCKKDPKNARRYANRILDIDPTNKEAHRYL